MTSPAVHETTVEFVAQYLEGYYHLEYVESYEGILFTSLGPVVFAVYYMIMWGKSSGLMTPSRGLTLTVHICCYDKFTTGRLRMSFKQVLNMSKGNFSQRNVCTNSDGNDVPIER